MKAVYLESGVVVVRDLAEPDLPGGYARIRMTHAGICNTDLELQRGYYGFTGVPGHKFVGIVTEGTAEWLGRRVVGDINLACGSCARCLAGQRRHCAVRTVLGIVRHPGAFAEQITLPVANLHEVPDELPDEVAVFTEPVAAACEILDQVEVRPGERVAVLGDGKLGLLVAQVLHAQGAAVELFGRHREKLALAASWGIRTALAAEAAPRADFGLVVDCTGAADGLGQAIAMTQPLGTVVMKSTVHEPVTLDAAAAIVNEVTLVGSRCGRFEPALALLQSGAMQVQPMVDSCYLLSDATAAFERASAKRVLKVLLRNSG